MVCVMDEDGDKQLIECPGKDCVFINKVGGLVAANKAGQNHVRPAT